MDIASNVLWQSISNSSIPGKKYTILEVKYGMPIIYVVLEMLNKTLV